MRIIIAVIALAGLSACSTGASFSPRPVSVGGGPNKLKRTPCAGCDKKTQPPGLPQFLLASVASAKAVG